MSGPAISVIVPAFNAERYIREALESIRAQTLQPAEIIVVDNGSTDGTAEIVRGMEMGGVRCESEPRRGSAHARNRGYALARGDYFSMLDADDLWLPQKLERQMDFLAANAQCEAVFGLIEHFFSPDLEPADAATLHCPEGAAAVRLPQLMLIRRAAFERVGPFATDVVLGDVVEWAGRAESAGLRHTTLQEAVYRRRIHAGNLSRRQRENRGDYLRIIKQKLDRERAAAQQRGDAAK